jgi:hypothetical protein
MGGFHTKMSGLFEDILTKFHYIVVKNTKAREAISKKIIFISILTSKRLFYL